MYMDGMFIIGPVFEYDAKSISFIHPDRWTGYASVKSPSFNDLSGEYLELNIIYCKIENLYLFPFFDD